MRARSDPLPSVRQKVEARDRYRCVRCGVRRHWSGMSVHHRHNRSHPYARLNSPANLIVLCGSGTTGCHGWCHAHPEEAKRFGWIVNGFDEHPELRPVQNYLIGWMLLNDEGGYERCAPSNTTCS